MEMQQLEPNPSRGNHGRQAERTLSGPVGAHTASTAPVLQRTAGFGRVGVARGQGRTRLVDLHQSGAAKIRLPNAHGRDEVEAVLINSAGGVTGGDRLGWRIEAGAGARITLVTQACERIYRSLGDVARIDVSLDVDAGARIDWLPQETILYDRSALQRTLEADVAPGGVLLVGEAVLLGRLAHREVVRHARFHDRWRLRRRGKLVFAEDARLEGPVQEIAARAATFGGRAAFATVVLLDAAAEALIGPVRSAIESANDVLGGASAFDGRLICRLVAQDGLKLRRGLIPLLTVLRGGLALPRVWTL